MFAPLEVGFARRRDALASSSSPTARPAARWPSAKSTPTRSPARRRRASTAPRSRRPSAPPPRASWRACSAAATARRSCARRCTLALAGPRSRRAGGAGRAPARVLRPGRSCTAPPASSTASSSPRCRRARFPLPEYKEHLLPDQLGAMVPHAITHAGSRDRPLHRPHPERLARADPVRPRRGLPAQPPADLPARRQPRLGQDDPASSWLLWQAFLQGSGPIVDIDPKGDHAWSALPGVAERLETIELSRRGALPRPARPDADRRPRRPARTSPTASSSRSCRRRSSPSGRPSCASRSPRPPPRGRAAAARSSRASPPPTSPEAVEAAPRDRGPRLRPASPGSASASAEARAARGRRRPGRHPADPQPHPAAGRHRARRARSRRSGRASRCCACSPPTRCASARPTPTRHSVLAMDEAWALTSDAQGRRPAGADQPPRPLAEHHPDPRHPDARRRRGARAAGRRALRLRGRDRGRGAPGARAAAPRPRRRGGDPAAARLPRRALLPARLRGPGGADPDRRRPPWLLQRARHHPARRRGRA